MRARREYVEAGGLMSYGTNFPDLFLRARASRTGMDRDRNVRIDYRWTAGNATRVRDLWVRAL